MEFDRKFTVTGAQVSTAPVNGFSGVVTSVSVDCVAMTKEFPDAVGRASATVTFSKPDGSFIAKPETTKANLLEWAMKAAPDQMAQLEADAVANFPATIPFMPRDE